MASPLTEYQPELELFESEQLEWSGESSGGVLGETEEMELAAELLEVRDEQELDRFLGNLIKKVGSAVGTVVRSPIGKAIGGILKGVLKRALPVAGGALGTSSPARSAPRSAAGSRRWRAARSGSSSKA